MRSPAEFGNFLTRSRRSTGFKSLENAVDFARSEYPNDPGLVARSTLSLYEQGKITNIKPIVLRFLSKLYKIDYHELATYWFEATFGFEPQSFSSDESFIVESNAELCALRGPTIDPRDNIEIVPLSTLEEKQSNLPAGSQVGVAATDFLDDHIFFDMVSSNIERGVRYFYLLPELERVSYEALLMRVEDRFPALVGKIDGTRTQFYPRSNLDFPVNYVVHIHPNGHVEGFLGILHGTDVQYHHLADVKLALRLYDAFNWAITVASDASVRRGLEKLQLAASDQLRNSSRKRKLAPLVRVK